MEEPILLAKPYLMGKYYEDYKKEYLRNKMILLPSIKLFSDNRNYIKALRSMIRIDKTLLKNPKFLLLTLIGFMPKFTIRLLRSLMIFYASLKIRDQVNKYNYFEKISQLI